MTLDLLPYTYDPTFVAATDATVIAAIVGPIIAGALGALYAWRKTSAETKLTEVNYLRGIIEEMGKEMKRRDEVHAAERHRMEAEIAQLRERCAVLEDRTS